MAEGQVGEAPLEEDSDGGAVLRAVGAVCQVEGMLAAYS